MRKDVDKLIRALTNKDRFVREEAASALGELADPRAVEPLIQALADAQWDVRWHAAIALGHLADARATDALLHALGDRNTNVRQSAATALVKIGPSTVEILIAALEAEDDFIREEAASALGDLRDARAVQPLIRTLADSNRNVRWRAVVALQRLGDVLSVEPLIHALEDDDLVVSRVAAIALGQLGDGRAVEPLIVALDDAHTDVRQNAANALGKLGDPRAFEPLCRVLQQNHNHLRLHAALALGDLGDVRAVEPLCKMLRYYYADGYAAQALGMLGGRNELPRRILLSSAMSCAERASALNALHYTRAWYIRKNLRHRYHIPPVRKYCERMRFDADPQVGTAAAEMLEFLERDVLVRPSQRDETTERAHLLRGVPHGPNNACGDELVRATEAPHSREPGESGFWKRIPWLSRWFR